MRRGTTVHFGDLANVCRHYFGEPRTSGSHNVYKMPWAGNPRINIQNDKGTAKAYQVRQVLEAIDKLAGMVLANAKASEKDKPKKRGRVQRREYRTTTRKELIAMPKQPYSAEKYTYRVIWSTEDQEHVGLCTEFPSLSHLAPTAGAAISGIIALVGDVLADMAKSKETPPTPLSLQQFKGNIAVRVPPERHRELMMEAAEAGVSLNRLISDKLAR